MGFTNFLNEDQISIGVSKAILLETILGVVGAGMLEDDALREAIGVSGGLTLLGLITYFFITRSLGWHGAIATFGRK